MRDSLRVLAREAGISINYTENKYTILSSSNKNGKTTIRVHKIFKECPRNIAEAIIDFYHKAGTRHENLNIIRSYADGVYGGIDYAIKGLDDKDYTHRKPQKYSQEGSVTLEELPISYIKQWDFWGDEKQFSPDQVLQTKDQEMVEFEIIVKKDSAP